jgi:hypothetical protein
MRYLAILFLAAVAHAQSLGGGSVIHAVPIEPTDQGYTIWLTTGAFSPTGKVHLSPSNNHFAFSEGHFILNVADQNFCRQACAFVGDFEPFSFGIIPISGNCSQLVGKLTGTWNGKPVTADYSQMWCHLAATNYMGGGELSVIYQ